MILCIFLLLFVKAKLKPQKSKHIFGYIFYFLFENAIDFMQGGSQVAFIGQIVGLSKKYFGIKLFSNE